MANPKTVIQKYFENIKMSDQEIATSMGVSYVTVGRWRRGEKVPQKYHRERLEQIALGHAFAPPVMAASNTEGQLDLLTKQIACLQESVGGIKVLFQQMIERVEILEGKKKHAAPVKVKGGSQ